MSTILIWNTPTHKTRDPCHPYRGGFIPSIKNDKKLKSMKQPEPTARAWGHACQKMGGWLDNTQGITRDTGWKSPQIITPTKI